MPNMFMQWLDSVGIYLVDRVLPAAVLFAAGVLLIRIVLKLGGAILTRSRLDETAHGLILKTARVVLLVLLGLMVASKMGIDVSGIVALASVLTLAVSLSVQDLLTNLISGFTLLYTRPFEAEHYVEIAGQSGTVKEIGLTYTKLQTPDNKIISIPNGAVTSAQIINYTVAGTRRVDISIAVSYDMDPDDVLAVLLQAAQLPTVLQDPAPFAAVRSFRESSVEYVLQMWTAEDQYWPTLFAANKNVKEYFAAKRIKTSYPHVVVHTEK